MQFMYDIDTTLIEITQNVKANKQEALQRIIATVAAIQG